MQLFSNLMGFYIRMFVVDIFVNDQTTDLSTNIFILILYSSLEPTCWCAKMIIDVQLCMISYFCLKTSRVLTPRWLFSKKIVFNAIETNLRHEVWLGPLNASDDTNMRPFLVTRNSLEFVCHIFDIHSFQIYHRWFALYLHSHEIYNKCLDQVISQFLFWDTCYTCLMCQSVWVSQKDPTLIYNTWHLLYMTVTSSKRSVIWPTWIAFLF